MPFTSFGKQRDHIQLTLGFLDAEILVSDLANHLVGDVDLRCLSSERINRPVVSRWSDTSSRTTFSGNVIPWSASLPKSSSVRSFNHGEKHIGHKCRRCSERVDHLAC